MPQDRFQCKECGTVDSTKFTIFSNAFKCNVCGAINPIFDSYQVIEYTGKIEVDGIATISNLAFRAKQLLESGNYDGALKLYKRILDCDADNHVALWGCYCCEKGIAAYYRYKDKFGNSGPLVKANILSEIINKYGRKAVECAPSNCAQAYSQILQIDIQFVNSVIKETNIN